MNNQDFKRNILSLISITAVILALIVISVIQYRWLISSTEKDLSELYRNINFKIYRSISYEVESEFYNFMELFINEYNSPEEVKVIIEKNYSDFTKNIHFIMNDRLYSYNGIKWTEYEADYINREKYGYFTPNNENNLVSYAFPISSNGPALGVIQFDLVDFYNNHIKNNNLLDNEYELKWYFKRPENSKVINEREYNYTPFKNIKDRLFNKVTLWVFGVSFYLDIMHPKEPDPRAINIRTRGLNPNEEYNLYVDIQTEGKSVIKVKEAFITTQWLITFMLLVAMGLSYIFILNQIRKLRSLRNREKIFVATITHELRTPLTVIHSAADNIQKGILKPERIIQYGSLIKEQSKRLSSMVEGILLFSRIEGKAEKPPVLAPVNLNELGDELKSLYPDTEVNINIPQIIMCHKETLMHILSNLVTNSIKHAYENSTNKPVRVKAHINMPNKIIITVEDDGIGIDKKDLKHIFKPFYRSRRSYDNQIKGSGLGLFIAYSKSALLNGELIIESPYQRIDEEKKRGCRFTLTIPYIPIKTVEDDE